MKIKVKKVRSIFALCLFTFYLMIASACYVDKNRFEVKTTPTPVIEEKPKTLADDLKFIENANFRFVYVFRKKDGEKFDSEDVDYLKEKANPNTNQWLKSEEGKTIIAGTNYIFDKKMLDALSKRFKVEDLSPEPEITKQNSNVNR